MVPNDTISGIFKVIEFTGVGGCAAKLANGFEYGRENIGVVVGVLSLKDR